MAVPFIIEENAIIDLTYVQEQIKMKKRKEILKRHQYSIWFNEKENVWYSYLPDSSKANNRRKIKRKNKSDLEKMICDYYLSAPNDHIEKEKTKESLLIENLFYEFMEHKTNEVNSSPLTNAEDGT